jgi:hypothetical protein
LVAITISRTARLSELNVFELSDTPEGRKP